MKRSSLAYRKALSEKMKARWAERKQPTTVKVEDRVVNVTLRIKVELV